MTDITKKGEWNEFDRNLQARLQIARKKHGKQLDVALAEAESELGVSHTPTSRLANIVYKTGNSAHTKPLARDMIAEGAELSEGYLTDEELLRKTEMNADKADALIDHTMQESHMYHKQHPLPKEGMFTRKVVIDEINKIVNPTSTSRG